MPNKDMPHRLLIRRPASGFTLIELMIALVLGLVMIGAAATVFLSNQQTFRTKAELDDAQEAFRFASHTIQRVVQQGDQIENPAADLLRVRIAPAVGKRDCLGRNLNGNTTNIFFIDAAGRLRCQVDNAAGTLTETLVEGLDAARTEVRFGVADTNFWSDNGVWRQTGAVANWGDVRSVRVDLAMQADGDAVGPAARFTATLRCHPLGFCAP